MWIEKARELNVYQNEDDIVKISLFIEELAYLSKSMKENNEIDVIKEFIISKISKNSVSEYNLPNNIAETIIEGLKNKIARYLKESIKIIEEYPKYIHEHSLVINSNCLLSIKFTKLYKCITEHGEEYVLKVLYNPFEGFSDYEDKKPFVDYMLRLSASLLRADVLGVVFLYNGVDISVHRPDETLIQDAIMVYKNLTDKLPQMESIPINAIQEAMDEYIRLHREYEEVIQKYDQFEKKKDKIKTTILQLAQFAKIDKLSYDKCKLYSFEQKYFNESDFKREHPEIYEKYLNKRKIYVVRYF